MMGIFEPYVTSIIKNTKQRKQEKSWEDEYVILVDVEDALNGNN